MLLDTLLVQIRPAGVLRVSLSKLSKYPRQFLSIPLLSLIKYYRLTVLSLSQTFGISHFSMEYRFLLYLERASH